MRVVTVIFQICASLYVLSNAAVLERRQSDTSTAPLLSLSTDGPAVTISHNVGSAKSSVHPISSILAASLASRFTGGNTSYTISKASMPTTTNGVASVATEPADENLPLLPRTTAATVTGGIILVGVGLTIGLFGVRWRLIQTFLSVGLAIAVSAVLVIDYVVKPPVGDAMQGVYLVAVVLIGALFGAGASFIKDLTEGVGCLLGGFCLSMWILTLEWGGTIQSTGGKAIFISVLTILTWSLSFSRYTRDYTLIGTTAFAGATASILGIDCFTRAGLGEFWLYIWDLNPKLFPLKTYTYPITRAIRVETVVTPILAFLGVLSQLRLWKVVRDQRSAAKTARQAEENQRDLVEELHGLYVEHDTESARRRWEKAYDAQNESRQSEQLTSTVSSENLSVHLSVQELSMDSQCQSLSEEESSRRRSRASIGLSSKLQTLSTLPGNGSSDEVLSPNQQNKDVIQPAIILAAVSESSDADESMLDIQKRLLVNASNSSDDSEALPEELEDDPEELRRPVLGMSTGGLINELHRDEPPEITPHAQAVEMQLLGSFRSKSRRSMNLPTFPDYVDDTASTASLQTLRRVASTPSMSSLHLPAGSRNSTGPYLSIEPQYGPNTKRRSSSSLKSSSRGSSRRSSVLAFSTNLVESPIAEDAVADFAPPVQSRRHSRIPLINLDSRRENEPQSIPPSLPARPTFLPSRTSLSLPMPKIRITSEDSSSIYLYPSSTASTNNSISSSSRTLHSSRQYSAPQPTVDSSGREVTLAKLRQSIRRNSAPPTFKSKIDLRRAEMMREKQQAGLSQQQQHALQQYRDSMFENAMRRTGMQALHREAMRKMQAQANKHM